VRRDVAEPRQDRRLPAAKRYVEDAAGRELVERALPLREAPLARHALGSGAASTSSSAPTPPSSTPSPAPSRLVGSASFHSAPPSVCPSDRARSRSTK